MNRLSLERWQRMRGALDVLLDLSSAEQDAWLEANAADDQELRSELRALLTLHADPGTARFLDAKIPSALTALGPGNLKGRRVGNYLLDSLVGEGGMGTVWKAVRDDGHFEGQVAVKLLNNAIRAPEAAHRFMREGRLLARLSHPNIARLLDAGVSEEGTPFLVLEYIDGLPIDRYCDEHQLDVPARLRLFLDVLAAVEHSHMHLVVHRDIKPSNVLVTRAGTPKLLDFGIARLADVDTAPGTAPNERTQTLWGGRAMTLQFAAPEQLLGQGTTTRSDVYGLGVLLYLLLTGRHPTGLCDMPAAAYVVPVIAGRIQRPQLADDLDNILLKALETDPAARYASASEFAQDLDRFLTHRPVLARADSLAYRAMKFVRRHRLATAASLIGLLALGAASAVAVRNARAAHFEANRAAAVDAFVREMFGVGAMPGRETVGLRSTTVEQLLDEGTRKLQSDHDRPPEARADLLATLAEMYVSLGQPAKALPLLEQRVALLESLPAASPLRAPEVIAATLVKMASAAAQAGLFERRTALLERAAPQVRALRERAPAIFGQWSYEKSVSLSNTDRAQSVAAAADAEAAFRAVGDSGSLVKTLAHHAFVLTRDSQYEPAELVLVEANRVVATMSPTRPELRAHVNAARGELHFQAMHLDAAERYGRDELAAVIEAKGVNHPMTAKAHMRLARTLMRSGALAESVEQARAAVAAIEATSGKDDRGALPNALEYLGQTLTAYGRLDEAVAAYTRAVQLWTPSGGALRIATAFSALTRIQVFRGDLRAAQAAHDRMLAAADADARQRGAQNLARATAELRAALGHPEEAVQLMEPFAPPETTEGRVDWARLDALSGWSTVLSNAADPRAARFRRAFRSAIDVAAIKVPLYEADLLRLEAAELERSDPAAAADKRHAALAIYEQALFAANPLLASLREPR